MDGRGRRVRGPICLVGILISTVYGWGAVSAAEVAEATEDEPILLGRLTREEIETAMPDWVMAVVEATPDVDAAGVMAAALGGAEVTVFFGSWCSDSGRELSRLWRALDEVGVWSPAEIRYIGVGRDMSEPAGDTTGQNLRLVPTFVVRRRGEEVGRIVESSPHGIENDLAALLRGEEAGLITGNEEFAAAGDVH